MSSFAESLAGLAGVYVTITDDDDKKSEMMGSNGKPPNKTTPTPREHVFSRLEGSSFNFGHPPGSRVGRNKHTLLLNGKTVHECFQCIMRIPGLHNKRALLTRFFSNKSLLTATSDYSDIQTSTAIELDAILYQFNRFSYTHLNNEFANILDLKTFLVDCGLPLFLKSAMELEEPYRPSVSVDPEWSQVTFHCISIVAALADLEEAKFNNTATHDHQTRVKGMATKLVATGIVQLLVNFVMGKRGIVETIKACSALRELTFTSIEAGYAVMHAAGIPTLGRLFTPGQFEKDLGALHDADAFDTKTRRLLCMGVVELLPDADAGKISSLDVYHRALMHVPRMQENAGAVIAFTMESCKEARNCLLNESCSVAMTSTMRWLSMPVMKSNDHSCTQRAVCVLRQAINTSTAMVNKLSDKFNFLDVLEQWMYPCAACILSDILLCYLTLVRLGGEVRARLRARPALLQALCLLVYCRDGSVQETALRVLTSIVQHHPDAVQQILAKHLISADMLRRAPRTHAPVVGLLDKMQKACQKANAGLWRRQDANVIAQFVNSPSSAGSDAGTPSSTLLTKTRDELREFGKQQFAEGRYEAAARYYSAALLVAVDRSPSLDDTDAVLYGNRAECFLRLGNYDDTVRDATLSIGLHLGHGTGCGSVISMKSAFRRGKAFYQQGKYFCALSDAAYCLQHDATEKGFIELQRSAGAALEKERRSEGHKTSARPRHRTCAGCGVESPGMKKCSRCEKAFFCSKSCLRDNWPDHQKVCQKED